METMRLTLWEGFAHDQGCFLFYELNQDHMLGASMVSVGSYYYGVCLSTVGRTRLFIDPDIDGTDDLHGWYADDGYVQKQIRWSQILANSISEMEMVFNAKRIKLNQFSAAHNIELGATASMELAPALKGLVVALMWTECDGGCCGRIGGFVSSEVRLICDLEQPEPTWLVRHVGGAMRGAGAEQISVLVRTMVESKASKNALRLFYALGYKLDHELLRVGFSFHFHRGAQITVTVSSVNKLSKLHAVDDGDPVTPGIQLVEVTAPATSDNYGEVVTSVSSFCEYLAP
uniref:Uncharacterized protein n=1 Tax=Chenopodium quinoa TaxID=63459 RepID=A0A803N3Z9_CHEQI